MKRRFEIVRAAFLVVAGLAAAVVAGCNTVSGLGEDLQEASENTSEAIDRAVNDNTR